MIATTASTPVSVSEAATTQAVKAVQLEVETIMKTAIEQAPQKQSDELLNEVCATVGDMKQQFEDLKTMVSLLIKRNTESEAAGPASKKQKRAYKIGKGRKIQRYNPDGTSLVQTYSSMATARQDAVFGENNKLNETSVRNAIRDCTVYKGYRWAYVENEETDDPQALAATVTKNTNYKGPYAELDIDCLVILETFAETKTIAEKLGIKHNPALCKAVRVGTTINESVYKLWSDCSSDLQSAFLEAGGQLCKLVDKKSKQVQQIDPGTGEVIQLWPSRKELISHYKMSAKTLREAINSDRTVRDFLFRDVPQTTVNKKANEKVEDMVTSEADDEADDADDSDDSDDADDTEEENDDDA